MVHHLFRDTPSEDDHVRHSIPQSVSQCLPQCDIKWASLMNHNFHARIRQLVYGFYQRLMCSRMALINCAMNSSAWLSSNLYRNWNKCLYVSEMVYISIFFLLFVVIYLKQQRVLGLIQTAVNTNCCYHHC